MDINVTLFIQIVAFLLLIYLVRKFLWEPVYKIMEDRRSKISAGLTAAAESENKLKNAEEEVKQLLQKSKLDAQETISIAEKRALEIIENAKSKASEETNKIKMQAQNELEQDIIQAKDALKKEVSSLVVLGVEKVLEKEVDIRVHSAVIDKLVKTL